MIGAVLDTNVMVSALLREDSPPLMVLNAALKKSFRCFVSEEVFAEYEDIYGRFHSKLPAHDAVIVLREFRKIARWVKPRKPVHAAFDQDDNKFLECALEARADYVVTGNRRHFPPRFQDIRIIGPKEFTTVLLSEL
jgi:putative PIN family toxin of toxin-antitoxin system